MMKNLSKLVSNPYFLLGIILLGAFVVRLYKIDNPVADWHSWRQADTASVTRIYLTQGLDVLHPKYHDLSLLQTGFNNPEGYRFVEFPVFNIIHYGFVMLMPFLSLEILGRLVSVISSLGSICAIFYLGKKYLGVPGGLLSAFFLAFLPYNIFFSRVILPDPLSVMFGLLGLSFLTAWSEKEKTSTLIISACLFALALLVKPFAGFYFIAVLWILLQKYTFSSLLTHKPVWIFGVISLLPLLIWRQWISQFPEGIPFYTWMFNLEVIRFKPAFWRWIFGERIGQMILGSWGVGILFFGLLTRAKLHKEYFVLAMALSGFLYLSIIAAANVRHDYYQIFIIPAIALLLARGVLALWSNQLVSMAKLITVFSIIFMIGFSAYEVRPFYIINRPELIEAGNIIDKVAPLNAKVLAPYNGDTALLYQTHRSGWPLLTYAIEEMIHRGATYYVSVTPENSETQDAIRKYIIIAQTEKYVVLKLEPRPKQP